MEQFFMEEADDAVGEVTRAALAKLRDAGAQIEPITVADGFEQVRPMHRTIMAVEAAEYHRRQFAAHRDSYGPMITGLLDEGLRLSGVDYAAALAWQRRFRRRIDLIFEKVDALIMPSTDTTAPATLDTTGTPKFQAPWSCAGVPAVSIPSGLGPVSMDAGSMDAGSMDAGSMDAGGMPAAVQLVARADHEAPLLQIARWCEQCLAFDHLPPLLA